MKEIFTHTFGVPPSARKSKPFVDHVMTFSIVDNKVWVRNYQISETADAKEAASSKFDADSMSLVEIGPRFVMTLITVLEGSFGGPKIYENKQYVSPNVVRSQLKQDAAKEALARATAALQRKTRRRDQVLGADPLGNEALFK